jgi:O-6-methylguanine DNA methyltransferase
MATKLQQMVWEKLKEIPQGKVTTYKLLANALESRAVRAVASAVGKNPYAPKVPCHRVVLSSGKIGNYTHLLGVKRKIELLESEGIQIKDGKIVDFQKVLYKF